ncbi:class II aldolase, partial [Pseudomonas sp. RTS4]|nr:class II aldolase [Pseudomonas sp. RTS4]
DIQVLAQNSGAELIPIHGQILAGARAMMAGVTKSAQGMGGVLAWPALLRKVDKLDPSYKE